MGIHCMSGPSTCRVVATAVAIATAAMVPTTSGGRSGGPDTEPLDLLVEAGETLSTDHLFVDEASRVTVAADGTLAVDHELVISGGVFERHKGGELLFGDAALFVIEQGGLYEDGMSVVARGGMADSPARIEVTGGATARVQWAWIIGVGPESVVDMVVAGPGTAIVGRGGGGGADLIVGADGTGELLLADGALVDMGDDFNVGMKPGGLGTALVTGVADGVRTTVMLDGNTVNSGLYVGGNDGGPGGAIGDLRITDGALVFATGRAVLAKRAESTATMTVAGARGGFEATLDVARELTLAGGADGPGGVAMLSIEAEGLVRAGRLVLVWPDGDLRVDGGTLAARGVHVAGGYRQTETGRLEIEVPSPARLAPPGRIHGGGVARLDGALTVSVPEGVELPAGWSIDLLTASMVIGRFAEVDLPPFMRLRYEPDRVRLVVDHAIGDLNDDRAIDTLDLFEVMARWGTCDDCDADLNADGFVDEADLARLLAPDR